MGWLFDDDKPKRRKIDKNTRDAVWFKYMGNQAEGKCYCCEIRTIHITDFQVGHNKAVAKGGNDNISNLRPICGPCNRGMGTSSIESYKKKYFGKAETTAINEKAESASDKAEAPINKKDLLSSLTKAKLKKIVKELDLDYNEFFDGDQKEDYLKFLMSSRKASVKNIQKILSITDRNSPFDYPLNSKF
jgi:hypothetical protein